MVLSYLVLYAIDLIVMDADEFLEKAEKERLCCCFPEI